ncbi:hypothetical protein PF011_g32507 [Phytophthora fragariae]|uniref:Uncharacterized protein n=1 Tax=Phytophthora fragariae TaxID=53985 RepID=A0A6A3G3J2_9STRA|nr:hypothetical protein PF011_g32507 [Phytophthora fragariae]
MFASKPVEPMLMLVKCCRRVSREYLTLLDLLEKTTFLSTSELVWATSLPRLRLRRTLKSALASSFARIWLHLVCAVNNSISSTNHCLMRSWSSYENSAQCP